MCWQHPTCRHSVSLLPPSSPTSSALFLSVSPPQGPPSQSYPDQRRTIGSQVHLPLSPSNHPLLLARQLPPTFQRRTAVQPRLGQGIWRSFQNQRLARGNPRQTFAKANQLTSPTAEPTALHIRPSRFASHSGQRTAHLYRNRHVYHVRSTLPTALVKDCGPRNRGNRLIFGPGLISTLGMLFCLCCTKEARQCISSYR